MQSGTIYPAQPWGVGLKEKFLSEYLQSAGYKTHAVGKVSYTGFLLGKSFLYVMLLCW